MNRIFALLFLVLFTVACNKDGTGTDCTSGTSTQSEETGSTTDCTVTTEPPVGGETTGGETSGSTTGGSTTGGSTTGGSTTGGSTTGGSSTGGTSGGLPTAAYTFDTNIEFLNTNSTQQVKFDKAIDIIKKVVATEEFRDAVINHTYGGKKTYVDNGGFTNTQIYQKILDGAETLQNTKNNTMDMEVELYYAATSTVGYTYANVTKIWVNTKYFNTNPVTSVAANLFHEWLHKLGFKHASSYSTSRDYSVPYAIGRMISTIGKDFD